MNSITATYGAYVITKAENGTITVTKDGEVCANTAQAIRDVAKEAGFDIDPTWNTRTAGAKLIKYLLTDKASAKTKKAVSAAKNKEKQTSSPAKSIPSDAECKEWKRFEEKDKYGFKDTGGKVVIPCVYDQFDWSGWQNGLIAVRINDKYGLINAANDIVIPIEYDWVVWEDKIHVFMVKKDNNYGLLDTSGQFVLPVEYDTCDKRWLDGCFLMKKGKRSFVVGENGVISRELKYDFIGNFEDVGDLQYALVRKNGKWGYLNDHLDEVTPCVNRMYVLAVICNNTYSALFDRDTLPKNIKSLIDDFEYEFEGHENEFKKTQKINAENIGALLKIAGYNFISNYAMERHAFLADIEGVKVVPIDGEKWWHEYQDNCDEGEEYDPDDIDIRYDDIEIPDEGLFIAYNLGSGFGHFFRLLLPDDEEFDPSALLIVNEEGELTSAEMKVMYNWEDLAYLGDGSDGSEDLENVHIFWDGEECDYPED